MKGSKFQISYPIERIEGKKISTLLNVKWVGYSSSKNTWEDQDDLLKNDADGLI